MKIELTAGIEISLINEALHRLETSPPGDVATFHATEDEVRYSGGNHVIQNDRRMLRTMLMGATLAGKDITGGGRVHLDAEDCQILARYHDIGGA